MLLVNGFTYFKVLKRHNRPKGTDRHNYTVWHTKMGVKESVKREVEIIEKRNILLKLFKGEKQVHAVFHRRQCNAPQL